MISVDEAQGLIGAAIPPLPQKERVSFSDALGRVLVEQVCASFPQPRFTNSAMDGYAVRAADVASASRETPCELAVVDVAAAGNPAAAVVGAGQCAQIMTGAPLPEGADSVVMVEQTSGYHDERVSVFQAVAAGNNVRARGEEVAEGDVLMEPGCRIGPTELGTLVTFGYPEVQVASRPKIAIYSTGDELREPGEPLEAGQIYNSNLHVLASLCRSVGAEVIYQEVVRDDPDALRAFFERATDGCDVVIASGGVSMGRFDFVKDVVEAVGYQRLFWKVAQKPGKPLLFAQHHQGQLFFGLPGNPISTLSCFVVYVVPALYKMQGYLGGQPVEARLAQPFACDAKRHRFVFGRAWFDGNALVAEPTNKLGSHMFTAALGANCLLEAAPQPRAKDAGQRISLLPVPWASAADLYRGAGLHRPADLVQASPGTHDG